MRFGGAGSERLNKIYKEYKKKERMRRKYCKEKERASDAGKEVIGV